MRSCRVAAALLVLALPVALGAQDRQEKYVAVTLRDGVPAAGAWIRVRNVNGDVRVRAASGNHVVISATKRWRRGDPEEVRIVTRYSADGGVLVCALWTPNATCDENGYQSHGDHGHGSDVTVAFDVSVPAGVKVGAFTVNGGVDVAGVTSDVRAETVNGAVEAASTGGSVQASSVNGGVHASMGHWDGTQDLKFSSVNGSVVAEFTGDVDADVDLRTVNGRFQTDWPVTITGRIDPRHLHARLGKGGREISLATVNGDVELRKR
jgi:hypothetical protein